MRTNEKDFAEAVQRSLGEHLLAVCDFSPGPSWGHNGIQTLVLTEQNLCVFQRGIAITARKDLNETALTTIPLRSIRSIKTKRRRALIGRGDIVTMHLATEHGAKTYTTKHGEQGSELMSQMTRRLS